MTGKQTRINFNLDGLDKMQAEMKEYVTRVGIFANKAVREDGAEINNPTIGAIHEFGAEGAHIPPRSFLRMPLDLKRRELMTAFETNAANQAIDAGEFRKVFKILGVKAEAIVQDAFSSGGFGQWLDIKDSTKAAKTRNGKTGETILVDTSDLKKSIGSDVVRKSEL